MSHYTETVGFPAIPINGTTKLRVLALSPSADAEVAGVTVSQWLIYGTDQSEGLIGDVVPLYTPLEIGNPS